MDHDDRPDADETVARQERFDDDRILTYARRLGIPTPADQLSYDLYRTSSRWGGLVSAVRRVVASIPGLGRSAR